MTAGWYRRPTKRPGRMVNMRYFGLGTVFLKPRKLMPVVFALPVRMPKDGAR